MLLKTELSNELHTLQDAVLTFSALGFSVFPVDTHKKPALPAWKCLQTRQPEPDELITTWRNKAIYCAILRERYNHSIVSNNGAKHGRNKQTTLRISKTGLNNQSADNLIIPILRVKALAGLRRSAGLSGTTHCHNLREQAVAKVHRYTFQYSQNKKSDNRPFAEVEA